MQVLQLRRGRRCGAFPDGGMQHVIPRSDKAHSRNIRHPSGGSTENDDGRAAQARRAARERICRARSSTAFLRAVAHLADSGGTQGVCLRLKSLGTRVLPGERHRLRSLFQGLLRFRQAGAGLHGNTARHRNGQGTGGCKRQRTTVFFHVQQPCNHTDTRPLRARGRIHGTLA